MSTDDLRSKLTEAMAQFGYRVLCYATDRMTHDERVAAVYDAFTNAAGARVESLFEQLQQELDEARELLRSHDTVRR